MNPNLIGFSAVFAAAAAWGMSGIFVTYIVDASGCSSVSLAFWRDLTTCIVLLLWSALRRRHQLSIQKSDWIWFILMGVCLGLFHIFYNQSVLLNGASVTTVEQAAMPAFVTLAALYLWKEPLGRAKPFSIIVIFVGTLLASGVNPSDMKSGMSGLAVGLTVPVFYAGWTICGKQIVSRYGPVYSLGVAFGIASMVLLFLQPFTKQPSGLSMVFFLSFTGLIGLSTVGAFTLYMAGLKHIQAGIASIIVMSEILFAGCYAWFLLGERFSSVQLAGAILVMLGVGWLSWYQGLNKKPEVASNPKFSS
ncbi:MAG: DMT family transporter [Desulfobacteraceae bacterium]|nr:MAG: DMT family transporter [Desulfobacteraceae bacterium]